MARKTDPETKNTRAASAAAPAAGAKSAWSNNNLACVNTWAFLRSLEQLDAAFDEAKDVKTTGLAFYNPAASAGANELAAEALASMLSRQFVLGVGADFEAGYDQGRAVAAMKRDLVDRRMTVRHLAATVDEAYNFMGERRTSR
jgi:hypothetical protein